MTTSISGYTTTFNCIEKHYPFEECVRSLLGFCSEVVVVDAGSTDGTIEVMQRLEREDRRVRFFVESVDFSDPRWAIHQDGRLKAKARARCTGAFCWQTDTDEIVPPEDFIKIQVLTGALGPHKLLMLPMVEFWGSLDTIRADFFAWKLRLSVNDPRITHGIPKYHRMYDQLGNAYPRPFDSDSCNYIWRDTEEDVPFALPAGVDMGAIQRFGPDEYARLYNQWLDQFPCVLHLSWLDLKRKIQHYRDYWPKFHASMYNLDPADTGRNNVMFDKPWTEVSDRDIAAKAEELKRIGPRSFHHKINPDVQGRTMPFHRHLPDAVTRWVAVNTTTSRVPSPAVSIVVSDLPLVSAVVTSYEKAHFLPETVQSLLAQDYPALEIIVVDDGSPDNTGEVTRDLIRTNRQRDIKLVTQTNRGLPAARNLGMSLARGAYILTIDGDDRAAPSYVSKGMQHLGRGYNLFCTDVQLFGSQSGDWLPNEYSTYAIRYDNSIPSMALFDRTLWVKTGGYCNAMPYVEDWAFWIGCSRHDLKVARLREKLFEYRMTEASMADTYNKDRHQDCQSLVMLPNADLFPLDEILQGHQILVQLPAKSEERIKYLVTVNPQEWILSFMLGLFAERDGAVQTAIDYYSRATELSHQREFQPLLRRGILHYGQNDLVPAHQAFTKARELRPDLSLVFREQFVDLQNRLFGAGR